MATFATTIRPTPFGFFDFTEEGRNEPGVYVISFSDCNYYYIGSSNKCKHRISQHISELKNRKHKNTFLQRTFDKHQASISFRFVYFSERDVALANEQLILDACYSDESCLNLSSNARVPKHSPEGRKILKEKLLQHKRNGFNLGAVAQYHRSPEGRKMHSEHAKKQRLDPLFTKRLTDTLRLKLRKHHDIKLINDLGECLYIGWNFREFCRVSNLDPRNLRKMIAGNVKSVKGWRIKNG